MTPPAPPSKLICIHWFVNKGELGAPGSYWQECEMCGKTFNEIVKAREVAARIEGLEVALAECKSRITEEMGFNDPIRFAHAAIYDQIAALQAELDELTADAATDRDTTDKGSEGRKTDA